MLLPSAGRAQPLTFQTIQLPVEDAPFRVVIADFNGDGIPDLAFLGAHSISLLAGKGDGTFSPLARITTPGLPPNNGDNYRWIAAADFDHDGKADLIFLDNAGNLNVYLDPGSTYNLAPVSYPAALDDIRVRVADLNNDGNPDIVAGGVVLLGRGDGSFSSPIAMPFPKSLILRWDLADFNGDGVLDLIVLTAASLYQQVYQSPYTLSIALGKGDGHFAAPVTLRTYSGPDDLVAGDFNGDGKADFVALGIDSSSDIFLGNGDATFERLTLDGPYSYFANTVAADMDVDALSDLVQVVAANENVVIYHSNGKGFAWLQDFPAGVYPEGIAVADLDGDGWPDIAIADRLSSSAFVLLNTSRGIRVSQALNAASFAVHRPVAPGSLISLFGAGLAPVPAQAASIPLPVRLGSVSVAFHGIPAPLLYVSPTQINLQIPWGAQGTASAVVTVNGASSAAFQVETTQAAPGVFSTLSGQAIAVNQDGSLAAPAGSISGIAAHPAAPGDILMVFATGLGPVAPSIADGAAAGTTLRRATLQPAVFIGGLQAKVQFAGLSPEFVGVNQLNVVVPQVSAGLHPLQIESGGVRSSSRVTIAVRNP